MKIDINKIPLEGLSLEEEVDPLTLDLETEIVKLSRPIRIKADVSKITNAITVDVNLNVPIRTSCSRCLNEFTINLKKNLKLNYQVNKLEPIIDLDPQIREEIILDYPVKPLCKLDCRGLCPKCGKDLNEGNCNCSLQ